MYPSPTHLPVLSYLTFTLATSPLKSNTRTQTKKKQSVESISCSHALGVCSPTPTPPEPAPLCCPSKARCTERNAAAHEGQGQVTHSHDPRVSFPIPLSIIPSRTAHSCPPLLSTIRASSTVLVRHDVGPAFLSVAATEWQGHFYCHDSGASFPDHHRC